MERRGSSEAAGKNFVQQGHCKYCDSRNRQSAVYFGLLLLLLVLLSASVPRRHFAIRVFEAREDGHLSPTRDPSNLSLFFHFIFAFLFAKLTLSRPRRNCLDSLLFPSVFSSIVNYREKEFLFRISRTTPSICRRTYIYIYLNSFMKVFHRVDQKSFYYLFYFRKFSQISVTI